MFVHFSVQIIYRLGLCLNASCFWGTVCYFSWSYTCMYIRCTSAKFSKYFCLFSICCCYLYKLILHVTAAGIIMEDWRIWCSWHWSQSGWLLHEIHIPSSMIGWSTINLNRSVIIIRPPHECATASDYRRTSMSTSIPQLTLWTLSDPLARVHMAATRSLMPNRVQRHFQL